MINIIAIINYTEDNIELLNKISGQYSSYNIIPRVTVGNSKNNYYVELSQSVFLNLICNGEIIEANSIDYGCIGTDVSTLSASNWNIGLYSTSSVDILLENPDINLLPIYINPPNKERLIYMLQTQNELDVDDILNIFHYETLQHAELQDISMLYYSIITSQDIDDFIKELPDLVKNWTK